MSVANSVRTLASDARMPPVTTWNRQFAGLLAVIPTVAILLVRVGANAPFGPRLPYATLYDPILTLAVIGPATAAIVLGVTTPDDVRQVALTFVGVFGLLSAVSSQAVVPASIAIVVGTALVLYTHARRPLSPDDVAETLVGVVFVGGVALSMASGLGLEPASTRPLGSTVGLLAMAGAPVFVEWRWRTVLVGVLAGVAMFAFGLAAPFVTGAASLVGGAIVGSSLPVLALAVVGGGTVVATGVDRRSLETVTGGLLVLTAGIPATVPRGLALLVGLAVLLRTRTNT
ncbi:MAG: hypothetical protein ABEJ44_05435 [Halanaeroarchaeum sp.]